MLILGIMKNCKMFVVVQIEISLKWCFSVLREAAELVVHIQKWDLIIALAEVKNFWLKLTHGVIIGAIGWAVTETILNSTRQCSLVMDFFFKCMYKVTMIQLTISECGDASTSLQHNLSNPYERAFLHSDINRWM